MPKVDRKSGDGTSGSGRHGGAGADAPGRRSLTDGLVRRRARGDAAADPGPALERAGDSQGSAPDPGVRAGVERATGADLGGVRVHTGPESAAAAGAVAARAFAVGQDIHFGAGEYDPGSRAGQHLLAHELAHTVQQQGAAPMRQDKLEISEPGDYHEVEADRVADAALGGGRAAVSSAGGMQRLARTGEGEGGGAAAPTRDLRHPELYPTYEEWCAEFGNLTDSFRSRDTPNAAHATSFDVIGQQAGAANPAATSVNPMRGEQHIEHVARSWIDAHLPEELRRTAYELPADCADIAIILRHVWLFAHGRSEQYGRWRIGTAAGGTAAARQRHLNRLIRNEVYSGSVAALIGNAYNDDSGRVRSFARLEPMLHPGDMLVWEHRSDGRRSGGHTQTIQTISKDPEGHITSITCLQGNQPVFQEQAQDILVAGQTGTSEAALRDLPGRRIERGTLSGGDLLDVSGVWTWSDGTVLLAAGPVSGATRPRAARGRDGARHRSVSDWLPSLRGASFDSLPGIWEAVLQETRAAIEGGLQAVTAEQGTQIGRTAGQRVTALGSGRRRARAESLSTSMEGVARYMGANAASHGPEVRAVFDAVQSALHAAAPQPAPAPTSNPDAGAGAGAAAEQPE